MLLDLSAAEVDLIRESLRYSKHHVTNARDTPYEVRQKKLLSIEDVEAKIRSARSGARDA
jgi:hypothetical protein